MPQKTPKRTKIGGLQPVTIHRLQLFFRPVKNAIFPARLIIMKDSNDNAADEAPIEYSDIWTDEDLQDLSTFALSHSENPHETDTKIPKP